MSELLQEGIRTKGEGVDTVRDPAKTVDQPEVSSCVLVCVAFIDFSTHSLLQKTPNTRTSNH